MAFINNKWRRDIGDNAINAAARIGGTLAAAYAIDKMQTIEGGTTPQSNMQKTLAIMGAPGITVLGLLGDLFVENPIVRSLCQGMYAYAAPRTLANMNDDMADAFGWKHAPSFESNTDPGTSGIGYPAIMNGAARAAIMNGVGNPAHTAATAYQQTANAVRQSAPKTESEVRGLAEAMIMN